MRNEASATAPTLRLGASMGPVFGHLQAFAASASFASAAVATRDVVGRFSIDALLVAASRTLLSAAFLLLLIVAFRLATLRISKQQLLAVAALGVSFSGVYPASFAYALKWTTSAHCAFILATNPLWTALLSFLLLRQRFSRSQIFGALLTVIAATIFYWEKLWSASFRWESLLGDALVLLCALIGAVQGVVGSQLMRKMSVFTLSGYGLLFGALVLAPTAAALEPTRQSAALLSNPTVIGLIAFLGVVPGVAGFLLRMRAISNIGPTAVAIHLNFMPLQTAALAALLVGESVTLVFVSSAALMIVGLTLFVRRRTAAD